MLLKTPLLIQIKAPATTVETGSFDTLCRKTMVEDILFYILNEHMNHMKNCIFL